MQLETKALYNFLRFTSYHNTSIKVKKWQIENLREVDDKKLFEKLKLLGINLDKDYFLKFSHEVETPEQLVDIFALDKEGEVKDQIYLILFELYRRFFSEKRCISIFCDELDNRFFLYDTNQLLNDEILQNSLANLKSILDANVDFGLDPKKSFQNLLQYLAHDLENFLFDYILDQIEAQNEVYGNDLIDSFYPYISKNIWFDFLRAKIKASKDISSSNEIIENILSDLEVTPNLDLLFRILNFMVGVGDRNLFIKTLKQTSQLLKKEKEFKQILNILADYYLRLDKDDMEKKVANILNKRSKIKNDQALKQPDINELLKIVS